MAEETKLPLDPIAKLHARLDRQDDMLCDIKTALVGNKEFKQPGFIDRLEAVELATAATAKKVEDHGKKFWLVSTIGTAAWATLVAFKEQIFGK